jgi:putative salt-induced outer membrane protein
MRKRYKLIMLTALLGTAGTTFAADEEKAKEEKAKEEKSPWTSSAEFGLIRTTGNTVSQTTFGKFDTVYEVEKWRHTGHAEAFGQQADDDNGKNQVSAERYQLSGKSDYKFSELNYVYGLVNLNKDRFSGFKYDNTAALGFGHKVIKQEDMELDLEIGPGLRFYKEDHKSADQEAVLRLAAKYWWAITENSKFTQKLSSEIGESVTSTESVTGVQANINKTLALKLTYTVQNKSKVPAGNKKTDTLTGMSLLYNF